MGAARRSARGDSRHPPSGPSADSQHRRRSTVWLFDLDNTLHDASHAVFGPLHVAMNTYIVDRLGVDGAEASRLRQLYFQRYGATLTGLVRHHGVDAAHFLAETHRHPHLESLVRTSAHDRAALRRLSGAKYILTNAPRRYVLRVLDALRLRRCFDAVFSIEDMVMFGHLRPKPDVRMMRRIVARLGRRAHDCVLVEDMLDNQRAACRIGMRTVWMQRYLGGRYRGAPHEGRPPNRGAPVGAEPGAPTTRRCPSPSYVGAKIRGLIDLPTC